MTVPSLTPEAVTTLVHQVDKQSGSYKPVLQVTQLKLVGSDRYRAVLSDGTHFVQGMLATQLNGLVKDGLLQDFTVLRLECFLKNEVQNKILIIILQAEILCANAGYKIGNPMDIEKVRSTSGMALKPPQPLYNSTNSIPAIATSPRSNPYGAPSAAAAASSSSSSYGGPSYGGPPQPIPSSSYSHNNNNSTAAIVRSTDTSPLVTPIAALNIYNNRWTIRARLTDKSDIRTWSNAKGEGSLFSIELLDESGTDIRGTFFKEAVDKFYNMLQVGQVYQVTGGRLKVANMQYNTCKSAFEITFDQNTEIHLDSAPDNMEHAIRQSYNFVPIGQMESVEANKSIDVLAICKSVSDVAHFVSKKTGQEMSKCDLTLVDDSNTEITMTVWRERAESAPRDYANQPVVAFRRARVSDYGGGKSLSPGGAIDIMHSGSSSMELLPQAVQLYQWWQRQQQSADTRPPLRSLSAAVGGGRKAPFGEQKTIASIKDDNLGFNNPEKGDYVQFKATVTFIKKDKEGGAWYPACPNVGEPCKNRFKVSQLTDQQWQCDKCQGTYATCVRRWIFSAVVEDGTSSTWVSFFNEQAEELLGGVTADQAYERSYSDGGYDQDAYDSLFVKSLSTEWVFKCKVKNEMVNEESRVKTSVVSMWPVDFVQEAKDMLAAIAM
jgi:replication factor A1